MEKCVFTVLLMLLATFLLASCDDKDSKNTPALETKSPVPVTTYTKSELTTQLSDIWEKIDGSTATIPLTAALYDCLGNAGGPPIHNTTSNAYNKLISKKSDLIFVTYPSENEFNMAQQRGVELEIIPIVLGIFHCTQWKMFGLITRLIPSISEMSNFLTERVERP